MWATIPFLVTMIVALLVVTYVPALTVVPEAERTGTVNNLVVMVHTAAEEGRAVKEVTIVDAAGNQLKDAKGQADRQEARRLHSDQGRVEEGRLPVAVLRRLELQDRRGRDEVHEQGDRGRGPCRTSTATSSTSRKAIILVDRGAAREADGEPVKDKKPGSRSSRSSPSATSSRARTRRPAASCSSACRTARSARPTTATSTAASPRRSASWVDANMSDESP